MQLSLLGETRTWVVLAAVCFFIQGLSALPMPNNPTPITTAPANYAATTERAQIDQVRKDGYVVVSVKSTIIAPVNNCRALYWWDAAALVLRYRSATGGVVDTPPVIGGDGHVDDTLFASRCTTP
jgi:hypothetical protein